MYYIYFKAIISDISSLFDPKIVYKRICHNILPCIGCILVGSSGTGKSRCLQHIKQLIGIHTKNSILVDIQVIDCFELSLMSITEIDEKINLIFNISNLMSDNHHYKKQNPNRGCIFLLDNVDALCPYISDQEKFSLNADKATKSEYLIEKFKKIFTLLKLQNNHSHRNAFEFYNKLESDNFDATQKAYIDLINSSAINHSSFIIATSLSIQTIDPRLADFFALNKVLSLPVLEGEDRKLLLISCLEKYNFHIKYENAREKQVCLKFIASCSEGLSPVEIESITKKIMLSSLRNKLSNVNNTPDPVLRNYYNYKDIQFGFSDVLKSQKDLFSSWDDVYGLKKAKQKILKVLYNPTIFPRLFSSLPIEMSRGILLHGPPGNGKTMLAKAAAEKCGLHLIKVKGPQLLNKYIGKGK